MNCPKCGRESGKVDHDWYCEKCLANYKQVATFDGMGIIVPDTVENLKKALRRKIELIGENNKTIKSLQSRLAKLEDALRRIAELENQPIDENECNMRWRQVGWNDCAAIAAGALAEREKEAVE